MTTRALPSVVDLHARLCTGTLTSVELTRRCLDRIEAENPSLNAVLALDDTALAQAAESDRRRAAGHARGPLDGIPLLVKDNIDTRGLATTAGSRLLAGAPPARDAEIVARARAAGTVLLGKTNLSEWANFRSSEATEGWSGAGGQTRHPLRPSHSPWGSSSGSAVAVATAMAPLALGTETDGSIVGPAGVCGVAGLKPETGLLPSAGIVPVSAALDVAGVLAGRLADAVTCLEVLAGRDFGATADLAGARFGLWRVPGMPSEVDAVLDDAGKRVRATIVPVDLTIPRSLSANAIRALFAEFRPSVENYLRTRGGVPSTLAGLIAANRADPVELSLFGQDLFEQTASVSGTARTAAETRAQVRAQARELIRTTLRDHGIRAVLAPSNQPAWPIDHANGDPFPRTSSTPAALAGYPNVSVPAGDVAGLPVGLSVFGPATSAELLPLALALEQELKERPC